ncbi:MAG: hypothetical protein ABEH77_02570 [Halobacteriaceae archaeon]
MTPPADGGRTRRAFLAAAGAVGLAGCAGAGSGGTTTTSAFEFAPADVGPYPEWMVRREGASRFLFSYYPEFARLVEELPADRLRKAVAARVGIGADASRGAPPTAVLDAQDVAEHFYGFTDGFGYHLTRGGFDAGAVRGALRAELGYEPLGRSVGEFDLLATERRAAGVVEGLLIDVDAAFADPVPRFEAVHATVRGDAPSFAADGSYALLADALRAGHWVQSRPNVAADLGVAAYGRQYVYGTAEFSQIQEVLVGDGLTADGVRAAVAAESGLFDALGGNVAAVAVDGRVGTVTYEPVPTAEAWGGQYGGFVDVYSTE